MNTPFRFSLLATLVAVVVLNSSAIAGLPIVVASDSGSNAAYSPQPDNGYGSANGGFGYNTWTTVTTGGGGGTYMDGVGSNGRGVPTGPDSSFAIYSAGTGYAISRPLQSSLAFGEFDIYTRFDTDGSNLALINLRTGNNTGSFGAGELLSFGIVGGNQLSYTDGSGFHLLPSGEARGSVYSWNVDFNAASGTFSLTVSQVGGAFTDTVTGNLEASGTTVGSFAAINTSSGGGNQNVIFNDPVFSVPEPGTWAAAALAVCGAIVLRRRNRVAIPARA